MSSRMDGCDRNNIAVDFLRQGLPLEATVVMRNALSELVAVVALEYDISEQQQGQYVTAISIEECFELEATYDASFAVYKKAFLLNSERQSNEVMLSLVLFYNLGLAYHALGLISGRSGHLFRALKLYRKVYALLSEHGDGLVDDITLPILATCNNMGHIYSLLHNTAAVISCHDQLRSIVAANQGSGLDPDDLDFFFMTVVLGSHDQGKFPTAPAA